MIFKPFFTYLFEIGTFGNSNCTYCKLFDSVSFSSWSCVSSLFFFMQKRYSLQAGPPKKDPRSKGVNPAAVQALLKKRQSETKKKGMYDIKWV